MLNLCDTKKVENELLDFCRNHKHLFLYGAGVYGETYYKFLKEKDIAIEAFITTNSIGEKFGTKIINVANILPELPHDAGIILSVHEELQSEILHTTYFPCDVLVFSEIEYSYIDTLTFLKEEYFDETMCRIPNKFKGEELSNILVVQLEVTFGDVVWSTAFIRELRRNYPEAQITIVLNPRFASLYRDCPYINKVMYYDVNNLNDFISKDMVYKAKTYAQKYLQNAYDAVFLPRLFPLTCSDAWENIFLAIYSDAKYRFGHALFFSDENKYRCKVIANNFSAVIKHEVAHHEVYNDLELLRLVNAKPKDLNMELWIDDKVKADAKLLLDSSSKSIAVGLVGSKETRSWDPLKYGQVLCELLKENEGLQIILLGGNDAKKAAKVVQKYAQNKCIDMTGKTSLIQSAAIISVSNLYLGSDTGLMHMASAFGVPVIEISASNKTSPKFWGSTPTRTGPWQVKAIVLQPEKGLDDCKYMCHKPYAHCINQISENDVKNAIYEMLKE